MRVSPILISRPESKSVYQNPKLEGMIKALSLPVSDHPISQSKLGALASDWSSGKIHYKEATNRFVDAVAHSLKSRLSEKDYQNMVDQLTDFLISDQQFIEDLGKNLSSLS